MIGSMSKATRDDRGWLVHTIRSEYQSSETLVRVLLPDRLDKARRYRVLYVLPVEAGQGNRYGDGLVEVKRHDLHNKHGLICVLPTFSSLPWYADHPTKPGVRQESHFLKVVLPLVERTYPALADRKGRLLVGFSKSGWGAFSLLLRHPDLFDKAAAWDAPLEETRPARFGMGPIFATRANFEKYKISTLIQQRAARLQGECRLVLSGYGNFRAQHVAAHRRLIELKIPHVWRDGPQRKHDWHSGWLAEAVALLAGGPDQ